jgi:hypothetical protein
MTLSVAYFDYTGRGNTTGRGVNDRQETLAAVFAARVTGKHNKDVLVLLAGERGSGKSYTLLSMALRCAEEIAKRIGGHPDDYFTFDNVAVIQDEDLENQMRNLKKFSIYILDDAGVGWDSRAFASTMNRRLNHILQTCRTDNCILLISVIDPFTIDKVPRTMVRYYGEIAEQLHDYGMNMVKMFRNKRLYREGKNLTPHMRFGHSITVRRWIAIAPPPEMAKEYDRVRDANAQKVKNQMSLSCITQLDSHQNPSHPVARTALRKMTCTHDDCKHTWSVRKKTGQPLKCPLCNRLLQHQQ